MSSMNGWNLANENQKSFAEYFSQQFQCPVDSTTATSLKVLSYEEIHSSGASLRTIERLDIEQLTLGNRDYSWATEMISTYGPYGFPDTWSERYLRGEIQPSILEESNVLDYIQTTYLRRALCGAIFLFRKSTNSAEEGFPSHTGCTIVNQSTSGPSGRPDRQVQRGANPCCLVEGKTLRACTASDTDGLEMIRRYQEDLLLYRGQNYHENVLKGAVGGKKKAMTILYQVWHQLLTRCCEHSIVANEEHFILALKRNNSLSISPMYSFSGVSAESSRTTLTHLSFFIAHSLASRHSEDGRYSPPDTTVPTEVPGPLREQGGDIPGQGDNVQSHDRLDSEARVWGTHKMGSFNLKAMCFLMADMIGWMRGLLLGQHNQVARASPLKLVFTTSGCASMPIALIPVIAAEGQGEGLRRLTLRTRVSNYQGLFSLFRGDLDGQKVVTKITEDDNLGQVLYQEGIIYNHLSDLQGSVVPTFLGLYKVGGSHLLVMTDCGVSLETFHNLTNGQREQLTNHVVCLHEHGVLHNDLEPRNVVTAGGQLKVIDFGMSELGHICPGPTDCLSLVQLLDEI